VGPAHPARPSELTRQLLGHCRFPAAATPVTCAVSGGADSLALLALAAEAGLDVTAVHVDHGLRPGSDDEREVVRQAAERFGASFCAESVTVTPGPNLESRARVARYGVLPPDSLLGHTADDQAETLVLNLLRGAGPDGIAAMRHDGRRPLLALRRAETRQLCEELGLDVVEDPTNADPSFRRNRVRHEVLPLLSDVADRDVVPLLVRSAELMRDVADHLDAASAAIDPTDAVALAAAPEVLARTALRHWLRTCSDEHHPPDQATVERVLDVARGRAKAADVGGGWRVTRSEQRLSLSQ
jgi:tRNA(Ile)-lysidine synthase